MYSIVSERERENRFKALKIIIIMIITAMMAIPLVQHLQNEHEAVPVESYSYYNEMVKFVGSNAFIGFDGNLFPVSWSIFQVNPNYSPGPQVTPFISNGSTNSSSPLIEETFSHYTTHKVQSLWQNSAVMIKWNHYVRIAEIFSFTTKGIDATVVIKNLNVTGSYIGTFSLNTGVNTTMAVNGFSPSCQNISSGLGIIPSNDWNVSVGSLSLNWQSEDSIFHSGIVSKGVSGDQIILPFVSGSLYHNESYTIDPMIYYQPYRIIGGPGPSPGPSPSPSPSYYSVTFSETGLSSGTSWYVSLSGVTKTSTSSSITFSKEDGTYSYTIGAVSGYSVSPSSGSVSVSGGSKSVAVTYTEQPTNNPYLGYLYVNCSLNNEWGSWNLTSSIINNTNHAHTILSNVILEGEMSSIDFSIPYKNANKGNGNVNSYLATNSPVVSPDVQIGPTPNPGGTLFRGILVYTLTSSGGWGSPIECNQAISGNGTLSFSWRTVPGVYGGFMVELVTNNGIARTYYNHPFDVYSRLVNNPGTQNPCYLDSTAVNTVYTSEGVFIGVLGITASRGPTVGTSGGNTSSSCSTTSVIPLGLSTVFMTPYNNATANDFTYGIFNYNQYLNYTGNQNGQNTTLPYYTPMCALNQAQSSNNANNATGTKLAEEAIYDLVETGLLMSPSPVGIGVGLAMTVLGPFLFQGSTPSPQKSYWGNSQSEKGISYGSWDQGGSGSNMPPAEAIYLPCGTTSSPAYVDPVYQIVNNGNGNPSLMEYFYVDVNEPQIYNETNSNQFGLNFFTYTASETIVPISHSYTHICNGVQCTYKINQNDYVNTNCFVYAGPSYAAATSMQIYLPMQG
ncbi:MAG: hypothetical protein ACYDAO_07520 [Thermoplasmataceae archaeon]